MYCANRKNSFKVVSLKKKYLFLLVNAVLVSTCISIQGLWGTHKYPWKFLNIGNLKFDILRSFKS